MGGAGGWTSIVMTVLFLGATQLVSLGIIGEYIERIYDQARQMPSYVIAEDSDLAGVELKPPASGDPLAAESIFRTVDGGSCIR